MFSCILATMGYTCTCYLLINSNQITFIVTSPQHKCLGEWNSYERAPDSAKQNQNTTIYSIYGQYIFTDCTEDNVQNTHTYTQYTQCTIKTYLVTNTPIHIIHRMYTSALCPHLVICEGATDYNLQYIGCATDSCARCNRLFI